MTEQEAIKMLTCYNKWRRSDRGNEYPVPPVANEVRTVLATARLLEGLGMTNFRFDPDYDNPNFLLVDYGPYVFRVDMTTAWSNEELVGVDVSTVLPGERRPTILVDMEWAGDDLVATKVELGKFLLRK